MITITIKITILRNLSISSHSSFLIGANDAFPSASFAIFARFLSFFLLPFLLIHGLIPN